MVKGLALAHYEWWTRRKRRRLQIVLTWQSGFAAGVVPSATADGTQVAVLTDGNGATNTYATDPGPFKVVGTSVEVNGALTAGRYPLRIYAVNDAGQQGVLYDLIATVT